VEAGVLVKELRFIPERVDPETGEITGGHKRQYIGPAGGSSAAAGVASWASAQNVGTAAKAPSPAPPRRVSAARRERPVATDGVRFVGRPGIVIIVGPPWRGPGRTGTGAHAAWGSGLGLGCTLVAAVAARDIGEMADNGTHP
jgi:hypothetical protein